MAPGDTAALHCSCGGATWADAPLAVDPATGLYEPSAQMAAGTYEGLLHVVRGGYSGKYWLPIPLAGLRAGGDSACSNLNNRRWTILPVA